MDSVSSPAQLTRIERLVMLLASFVLIGLLGMATWIEPDTRGYGTHEQFGLSPCWFIENWNTRCPSCGMTTSWAHLVRGNVLRSLQANSGGTALALMAAWLSWSLLASAMRGHMIGQLPGDKSTLIIMALVITTIAADWIIRLL